MCHLLNNLILLIISKLYKNITSNDILVIAFCVFLIFLDKLFLNPLYKTDTSVLLNINRRGRPPQKNKEARL
jgi:hypothetical protein